MQISCKEKGRSSCILIDDSWMDGYIERQVGEWTDGRMEGKIEIHMYISIFVYNH